MYPTFPEASPEELEHLIACADAVGCTIEAGPFASPDGTNPWQFVSPIGPRQYGHFPALRWAVFDEMKTCFQLGLLRKAIEAVLADPEHALHATAWAWWQHGDKRPDTDDLSVFLPSPALRLGRALGCDPTSVPVPTNWTADERAGLRGRGDASRSVRSYIEHACAHEAAAHLVEALQKETSGHEDPMRSSLPNRRRL